jgi:hypothetical protein
MMIDTPPPSIRITRLSDTSEVPEPQLGPMTKRLKHKDIRRNKPHKRRVIRFFYMDIVHYKLHKKQNYIL